jgi:hypothetical protein
MSSGENIQTNPVAPEPSGPCSPGPFVAEAWTLAEALDTGFRGAVELETDDAVPEDSAVVAIEAVTVAVEATAVAEATVVISLVVAGVYLLKLPVNPPEEKRRVGSTTMRAATTPSTTDFSRILFSSNFDH